MSFVCYPVIISRSEGKEIPTPYQITDSMLDNSEIAIKIISDKENEFFKEVQETFKDITVEYIVVVVKYLNNFRA